MRRIDTQDKIFLYLICTSLYFVFQHLFVSVVPIIVSIIAIGLVTYFEEDKIKVFIALGYAVLSYYFPSLMFYIPVLIYGVYEEKTGYWVLAFLLPIVFQAGPLLMLQSALITTGLISLWLKNRTLAFGVLKKAYLNLSDAKRELAKDAKLQSQMLIEKQDNEIHAATLNERNRISREIHDNVGHQLTSAILQVGALRVVSPENKSLELLNQTLNSAMDHIRNSVHDLYDASIDLEAQVNQLVDSFNFCDIRLNFQVDQVENSQIKYAIIAIVKEALSNIIKHSNATMVDVTVYEHPSFYQLIVKDNGVKAHDDHYEGIGLKNITHRIETLKGQFRIRKTNGFELFITIPKEEKS